MKDAWRTKSWNEKFTLWFKPTGYRPADVAIKYPVYKIEDVYNFEKYETRTSPFLNTWCWIQLIMLLLFLSYLFGNIASINQLNTAYIFWYGGFIFLSVYALTELMDRNPYAIVWEFIRCVTAISFLVIQKDWFGASTYFNPTLYILAGYFIISLLVTFLLATRHFKEDRQLQNLQMDFTQRR